MRPSSGEASRANQQRDPSIQRAAHHYSSVPRNGLSRRFCLPRTEIIGSGIRRTGIAPDEIRTLANGSRKTFFKKSRSYSTGAGYRSYCGLHSKFPFPKKNRENLDPTPAMVRERPGEASNLSAPAARLRL